MNWIIEHKDDIISIFSLVCAIVVALVQVVKYKKYSKELKMSKDFKQSFVSTKPEYAYDPATKEIEPTGKTIDIQAQIDSHLETRLESILERFMNPQKIQTAETVAVADIDDDIDKLAEMIDEAEGLREKYKLGDNLSVFEIYQAVENLASTYAKKIDDTLSKIKPLEADNKVNKEV